MTRDFTQSKILLDASPIAMVITDQNDKIILCNGLANQLCGLQTQELIGKALQPLVKEFTLQIQSNAYQLAGEKYFLSTLSKPPKNTALEEIEEKYYALLEGTDASITMFSADGTLRFANSIAARRLGMSPEEVVGKKMIDLFPKPVADQQLKDIQCVIQSGEGHTFESKTILQGNVFWYRTSIQPVRNASGKATAALINAIDITKLKTAEDALRESEGRLQLALKGIDLGWWESNIKTGEIIYNDHWMALMGFPPGNNILTTAEMATRIHPEDLPKILQVITQHFKKRPAHSSYEYRFRAGNGEWKWILDLGKVIEWGEDGKAIRAAGICLDITDRVSANKELIEQKRLLEKKNEELEEFSYLSAHDLKSPIVSIVALLEQLHNEDIQPQDKEKLTEVLLQSAQQIKDKIITLNEIIALKKTFNLEPESINVEHSFYQVRSQLDDLVSSSGADIEFDFSKNDTVYFPPSHFKQVLRHLISNSIKFQKDNEPPKIHLYTQKTSKYVILVIRDYGKGFDMDRNGNKVFGIFNRFHSQTTGIGAGLYIVYSIMTHYQGRVEIESNLEEGTTVTLYFRDKNTD